MLIMTQSDKPLSEEEFEKTVERLHKEVYGVQKEAWQSPEQTKKTKKNDIFFAGFKKSRTFAVAKARTAT